MQAISDPEAARSAAGDDTKVDHEAPWKHVIVEVSIFIVVTVSCTDVQERYVLDMYEPPA